MPDRDRPNVPEGYGLPANDEGLLNWEDTRTRLEQAKYFWICTASSNGKPHARPLWGAWVQDTFYFDGALTTRWGQNLSINPQVEIHLESGAEVVIIEGLFSISNDLTSETFEQVRASYKQRYESYQPEHAEGMYMIRPNKVIAWKEFPKDMTRFRF